MVGKLEELPLELLLDELLPLLPLRDLLNLFSTNKFFAQIGRDDAFWHGKIHEDYNFNHVATARRHGWKFLYSRLKKSKTFIWGDAGEGRLGRERPNQSGYATRGMQTWPLELEVTPGGRIVQLGAGGWSFTALDFEGHMHVWGQLEAGWAMSLDGYSNPCKQASNPPKRLKLPTSMLSFSCGRNFVTGLDAQHRVWCFLSWGRPFIYDHPVFDATRPETRVVQVESGWTFGAALTASGLVYAWNPTGGQMGAVWETMQVELDQLRGENGGEDARALGQGSEIQCYPWAMKGVEPLALPELPELPNLYQSDADAPQSISLVQIGAGDQFIIGLTNGGHVVQLDLHGINEQGGLAMLREHFRKRVRKWQYLPTFSELEHVKALPEFKGGAVPIPSAVAITHISAHFHSFVAYSTGASSTVLMGKVDPDTQKWNTAALPELQNRGVISVVLGDYHYGALLEDGKLLTWGQVNGCGIGNPFTLPVGAPGGFETEEEKIRAQNMMVRIPPIGVPTEVRFDHGLKERREAFVFGVAAAGWHMGALVIDLGEGTPEVLEEEKTEDFGASHTLPDPDPPAPGIGMLPGIGFPFRGRGGAPFRIGYAGRGAFRGAVGRGTPPS